MGYFLERAGLEFVARRRRLRSALGERSASGLEFLLFTLPLLGLLAPVFAPGHYLALPWAPAIPVLLVLGYLSLEARRQRAMAPDEIDPAKQRRFDRLTLGLLLLCCALGVAAMARAVTMPEPAPPPKLFELAPDTVPEDAREAEIGP